MNGSKGNPEKELKALDSLSDSYQNKNVRFIVLVPDHQSNSRLVKKNNKLLTYFYSYNNRQFFSDYLVSTLPRFLFIDAQGCIIRARAPQPTENIHLLFSKVGL